jgi:hypothetical protein
MMCSWYFSESKCVYEPFIILTYKILPLKNDYSGGSKMATGTQQQTAWAPWITEPAKALDTYLAEVKHQRESKVWHSKALDHGRLLHAMIYQQTASQPSPHDIGPWSRSAGLLSPQAPTGLSDMWDHANPCSTRIPKPRACQAPALHRTTRSTLWQDPCPLDHARPQLCRLARLPFHQDPTRKAAKRGLQTCLRDTDRQSWMLKE